MKDFMSGFALGIIIIGNGWMVYDIWMNRTLPKVAEHTGVCGACNETTIVTIRETR